MNYILTLGFVALEMGKQKKKQNANYVKIICSPPVYLLTVMREQQRLPQLSFIPSNFYSLFFYLVSRQPKGA
jgi:hypothetical protein